jgi:hypothetical protein
MSTARDRASGPDRQDSTAQYKAQYKSERRQERKGWEGDTDVDLIGHGPPHPGPPARWLASSRSTGTARFHRHARGVIGETDHTHTHTHTKDGLDSMEYRTVRRLVGLYEDGVLSVVFTRDEARTKGLKDCTNRSLAPVLGVWGPLQKECTRVNSTPASLRPVDAITFPLLRDGFVL